MKVAAEPAPRLGLAPGAAERRTPAPSARRGTNLLRLNVLLGTLLVVLIAGPPAARWYQARRAADSVATPSSVESTRGARPPLEGSGPAPVEPRPTAPSGGAEAALSREALALYREGRVAEACAAGAFAIHAWRRVKRPSV